MATQNNRISQISLGTGLYDIYDASAIHSLGDLGIDGYIQFKGAVAIFDDLPMSNNKVGDVYHVIDIDSEYIWVESTSPEVVAHWEEFGSKLMIDHTHGATVSGTNKASAVTGSVTVPTVSRTQHYMTAASSIPEVTPSTDTVLGTNTTFTATGGVTNVETKKLSAIASEVAIDADGTAKAITALGTPTTASAITGLSTTTVNSASSTTVNIPNVTDKTDVEATKVTNFGSAADWKAEVSGEVLSFTWTPNSVAEGTTVTASQVSLGADIEASKVTTSSVTVATGSEATADVITGFGAHTTADALTGVKVTAQPTVTLKSGTTGDIEVTTNVTNESITVTASGDNVTTLTGVALAAPTITLTNNNSNVTGSVPVVSAVEIGSVSAELTNGIAAAQEWTGSVVVGTVQSNE